MATAVEANARPVSGRELLERGIDLLSQQIWCWGQDILRPDGNWLLESGFERIEAPPDRENCSSVYALEMPSGRRVVLRGFGVFFSEDGLGGVFLPRYEFRPQYTVQSALECPPWSDADLPELGPPEPTQRDACAALTLGLIEWIERYETNVAETLGTAYRQAVLDKWGAAKRPIVPAHAMAHAWRSLGVAVAENVDALIATR